MSHVWANCCLGLCTDFFNAQHCRYTVPQSRPIATALYTLLHACCSLRLTTSSALVASAQHSTCCGVLLSRPRRLELFKPHYVLGPRPAWASVPQSIEFGASFTVTLAANTTVSDIVAVVLSDQGTTTHSSNMATRTMLLQFSQAGGQALTVTAPANIHIAQPGHYMVFAVGRDDTFSVGKWLRLKGPWGSTPSSLPAPTQFVATASSQFEAAAGEFWVCLGRQQGARQVVQRCSKRAGSSVYI